MANITASMVKELREMTGAGMMECKKALAEADGDMDGAVDVLRTRGLAAVAKKAGRATNEGTVMALVSEDGKTGALVELNCETDFVGMNEKFKAYAEKIARAAVANKPADLDALKASEIDGETVEAVVADCIHVMGENTQLARFATLEADAVCSYIHMGGKIGVLVSFATEGVDTTAAEFAQCGRDVAMQVAAVTPSRPLAKMLILLLLSMRWASTRLRLPNLASPRLSRKRWLPAVCRSSTRSSALLSRRS